MIKRQENRLTMYEGVLSLLRGNESIVNGISGFAASAADFAAVVNDLKAKAVQTGKASAGKTAAKHNAEDELVECLSSVCSALYVFGRKRNNAEIMERADITEYKLRRMRDTELAGYGRDMADTAEANSAELAALGLSPDRIADLKTKAAAYDRSLGDRESGVANRMGSREEMNRLFEKADGILEGEVDRFAELVKPGSPEFYDKYWAARSIRDAGIRHRKQEESPEAVGAARE